MGIMAKSIFYIDEMLWQRFGTTDYEGLRLCELGNQFIRPKGRLPEHVTRYYSGASFKGKRYFEHLGFDTVCIDINGKDESLPLDLTKPIARDDLLDSFDVVVNAGTTEHIPDQYWTWWNIHNLCRTGGVVINILSLDDGSWFDHAYINYSPEFFGFLAQGNGYSVVDRRITDLKYGAAFRKESIFITLRKEKDVPFVEEKDFAWPTICEPGFAKVGVDPAPYIWRAAKG
uniref:Putative methyltransferase n=1 Tax=viral metagenome TaxID=1070528 RepID=A0A6M3JUE0_9ZZZZ